MTFRALIILLVCFIGCANSQSKTEDKESTALDETISCEAQPPVPFTHYPLTSDYLQGFMDSTIEFTQFYLIYDMNIDMNHHDIRKQRLTIMIRQNLEERTYLNMSLSNIESFYSYYTDKDIRQNFEYNIPENLITPILQMIQQQGDYYFNAEEYGGDESLEYYFGRQLGHVNHIALDIYPADRDIFTPKSVKAFCKGWDPGADPPEELMPLIDYIENVILPEMRQHPN